MTEKLAERHCIPCEGGMDPLGRERIEELLHELGEGWRVVADHHLDKKFTFDTYRDGVDFVNEVAAIAEHQGHHPDIYLGYGRVRITLWTHKIDGLSENDFIMAARIEQAVRAIF